jgi:hypothetical protein
MRPTPTGGSPHDDHWALRREAASLLAAIAAAFAAPHHNLRPRLCRVLAQAWLEQDKPLASKYGAVVGMQALGPQVVRTLLIPHLEPFMSAVLVPAMAAAGAPAAATSAGGGSNASALAVARRGSSDGGGASSARAAQQRQQQQQLLQADAWQVYGALVSAVGVAMYDLLMGQVGAQLPLHLLLPRSSGAAASDWQQQYTQALRAARQAAARRAPATHSKQQQQQQQHDGSVKQDGMDVDAAPQHTQQQRAFGRPQPPGKLQGPVALRTAASWRAADANEHADQEQQQQQQQLEHARGEPNAQAVAQVLGQSWREDSDVNVTLGVLLGLFGEDLLPCLPLPHLAAVSL